MSLRSRKKRATRAAIIEAARRLFAERGYEGTRTRDIAEEAGIAAGTLFNYAPTKEDVVLLVWKDRASALGKSGLAAARKCGDPADAMVAIFGPILEFYAEDLELGRVFLYQATYADASDPEMFALNEGFVAQLALILAPHAGVNALYAAINVFAAFHTVLTTMLAGRVSSAQLATSALRDLVRLQVRGWRGT